MGGGDLNLKKSWHPSTMKNMERVWKAEQQDSQEKKRISELKKEIEMERDREEMTNFAIEQGVIEKKGDKKLDWMYKGPNENVNREEYLLGRKIDKQFEQMVQAEKEAEQNKQPKNHVEHECIPPSLRYFSGNDQVDLTKKLQEDPLYAIKKKEMEARTQLLKNPVKLKQLQQLVQQMKAKSKNKKKKKNHSSDSDSDKKLDDLIASKYKKLKNKILEEDLIKSIKKLKKNKKSKKKKKKESSSSDSDSDSESDSESDSDTDTDSDSDSDTSSDESVKQKSRKHKRNKSKSKKKKAKYDDVLKNYSKKLKKKKDSTSDDSESSSDEFKEKRKKKSKKHGDKDKHSKNHKKKQKNDKKKKKKENSSDVESDSDSESSSDESIKQKLKKNKSYKEEKYKKHSSRNYSNSSNYHNGNYKNEKSVESKYHHKTKKEEDEGFKHYKSSDWDRKERSPDSGHRKDRKEFSDNSSKHQKEKKDESTKSRSTVESYGLMKADGSRISPSRKRKNHRGEEEYNRSNKFDISKKEQKWVPPKKQKLSEEEKERRRQEMVANALVRDKERKRNVKKYEEEEKKESLQRDKEFDKNFLQKHLAIAANQETVASRIKSNINNIQRTKHSMDKNFARR